MRLAGLEVANYKGIARARLEDVAAEAVVMISGRNGTGKSLLLEALVGTWSGRYSLPQRVGPWGDECSISIALALTPEEFALASDWHQRQSGQPLEQQSQHVLTIVGNRLSNSTSTPTSDPAIGVLRNTNFQREHPFAVIDFLPATRSVPATPSPTVDLAMLNVERVEQDRYNMLDSFINNRGMVSLPNVASYLVTLDYQNFLAERQGLSLSDEYARLAQAFVGSTGKELLLPEYDPARGSNIEIKLPSGHRHGLADLSSGEQEMLALMYFVRRLSAAGGILCLDEPEQHLHPTLQAALFDAMGDLAQRAQVIAVSHSVNLIASAPMSGLVQMGAPTTADVDQLSRLRDEPDRTSLIAALGITPADLLQSDMLCVVEGDTDQQWLRMLMPVELGRAHIMIAGSGEQVVDAHDTLAKFSSGLPWICVRDRDLMTDAEVAELQSDRPLLHVWPRRAIENLVLDAELLAAALTGIGRDTTPEAAQELLTAAVDPLRNDVLSALVEHELRRRHPPPPAASEGDRFDRMEEHLRRYARVNIARAEDLGSALAEQRPLLDARWKTDWPVLVDPKPALARLAQEVGGFHDESALATALFARARDDAALRPVALEEFRQRVAEILP